MTTDPPQSAAGEPPPVPEAVPAPPSPAPPAPPAPATVAAPKKDRWAHRRGEPRLFVFLWTMYLFFATVLTLLAVSAAGYLTADTYRPAARLLVTTVVAGVVILWPLIRLSQAMPPTRTVAFAGAVQDYFVVMLPAQAVIWPQWSLAALPAGVVAALSANIAAWGLVVGGLLAIAQAPASSRRDPSPRRSAGVDMGAPWRVGWMIVFIAVGVGGAVGPLLAWGGNAALPPARAAWMLSPLTAVFEILADRAWTGRPAVVTGTHWRATGVTAIAGLTLWLVAWVRANR